MIKDSSEVLDEVFQRYNRDPSGWKVTVGSDTRGRAVILFQKGVKVWQIKTHHITPYRSLSLGGKTKGEYAEPDSSMQFGWRALSSALMMRIKKELQNSGELSKDIIEELSEIEPHSLEERPRSFLEGPFNLSEKPLSSISCKQEKLDKLLSKELDKLLFKKEGSGMYG